MKKDFLEMLMSKIKVVDFDDETNTVTATLFTVQDVFSLAVYKQDLFFDFLNKNKISNSITLDEDSVCYTDSFKYCDFITNIDLKINFTIKDIVLVFQPLLEQLISQTTKTETFKELVKQFDLSKRFTIKFVNEWNEELHSWTHYE